MPSDPIPPLATDNLELERFIDQSCSESELDGSPCHRILIPPSTSTMPQDCPVPFESDSDLIRPFPVEVFEHIIDQSDDLDGSLCHLSLTCRTFLPRARVNLFFRIHIGHKEKLESAPAFLEAWSWLPPLVHAVTIRDYFNRDPFMLHAVVPSRLIAMLPRLHSLEFERDAQNRAGDLGDNPRSQYAGLAYSPSVLSILRKTYAAI